MPKGMEPAERKELILAIVKRGEDFSRFEGHCGENTSTLDKFLKELTQIAKDPWGTACG